MHRDESGTAPMAGPKSFVHDASGLNSEEVVTATANYPTADYPTALESMVKRKFTSMGGGAWKVI